jgi:type II secretory pathway component GspD/PulD (secretin)
MNMDYIKKLIEEFDVAVDLSDPYEQSLNYVAASDMLPILADMLQEEGDEGGAGDAGGTGAPTRVTTGGIGTGVTGGTSSGTGGVSGAGQLGSLEEPGEQQAAQSVIVGKTRLIADNRANSILVIGQPEARDKVKAILDKLDKRPMQVYLATVIGQLRVLNDDQFAVNILQKYVGGPQTGAASVSGGRSIISSGTNGVTPLSPSAATLAQMAQVASAALPGMQIATFIAGSIDLYIQALTATARFRIASRPSVFTANNKKAVIFNGRKIAVPTSTVTSLGAGGSAVTTTGSQQSNIQYQDVVLKIEVVPLINSAREITLQIIQTNDNIIPGANTNIGGGVTVPEIATQELTTTVIVPDRGTILLGGLITQQDDKTVSGVPFLSTIPLMGTLFKSTTDTTRREELVVMIQPSVVQDTLEMREVSKTERDLTGFSSKELSPISMKVGSKTAASGFSPAPSSEELPEPPTQE